MNNKENYKKAIDQIHAKESLKSETLEKMKRQKRNNLVYLKYISGIAAVFVLGFLGIAMYNSSDKILDVEKNKSITKVAIKENEIEGIERLENIEQLKNILEENNIYGDYSKSTDLAIAEDSALQDEIENGKEEIRDINSTNATTKNSYSETNNQVEGVDEADIVKTDGKYIYYKANGNIYIVEANSLEITAKIEYGTEYVKDSFSPSEIFINDDKLIVLGTYVVIEQTETAYDSNDDEFIEYDYIPTIYKNYAQAIIYDISNKDNPKEIRKVVLDGYYQDSRMIGDNIYFTSTKSINYYKEIKDIEILPVFQDTSVSKEMQSVECTDIAYFENGIPNTYLMVGGFNLNNNEGLSVETFLGYSSEVYCSENNMYIVIENYTKNNCEIYKFALDNGKVSLVAKGDVEGEVNNQFSIDEYEGNLRVATTVYNYNSNSLLNESREEIATTTVSSEKTTKLTILDESLNKIGSIEDLAKDEEIYSVRFIGKIGYVVTFEEIDPLFVLDLSDPTNPQIKGELELPGYSNYLHPYDENHIIGIGYNTKSNGYGGVINDNMKMTMFDISDLENPKEMFSIDIDVGNGYYYSEINYNHKVLFYNKDENLIGFPFASYSNNKNIYGFVIYKIDLEEGFSVYTDNLIKTTNNYYGYDTITRVIYIDDTLYTLSNNAIVSYDLEKVEEKNRVEL